MLIFLYGSVAQLVEQRPEEPCVAGSSPAGTTKTIKKASQAIFYCIFLFCSLRLCFFVYNI